MAKSMNRLLGELEQACLVKEDSERIASLYSEYYAIAQRKLSRSLNRGFDWAYNFPLPRPEQIIPDASVLDIIEGLQSLKLHGSEHEFTYYNSGKEQVAWTKEDGFVNGLRLPQRVIIDNPLAGLQSWYHPVNDPTPKHRHFSSNPHASRFLPSVDQQALEREVFEQGLYLLDSRAPDRRAFVLASFSEIIGQSADQPSHVLRLQADRERTHRGYRVRIHGYPISYHELIQQYEREVFEKVLDEPVS